MEHWSPLLQTILWVILIGGITWKFYKPIYSLLEALADRVRGGSDVTAGPFSVRGMQPTPPSEQAERASQEINEAHQIAQSESSMPGDSESPAIPVASPAPTPQFRAQYFQAEDLALRAVQAEFGEPINRQVQMGGVAKFDGAFVKSHRLNVVEVKYWAKAPPKPIVQQSFDKLLARFKLLTVKSINIIFVAVVDRTSEVAPLTESLTKLSDEAPIPTVIRVYALSELQAKFGVVDAG